MLKSCIKFIINKLGFYLCRSKPYFSPVWEPNHSNKIDTLDLLVQLELCRVGTKFSFLQIGANDGLQSDPLSKLIRAYQLSGMLVEAHPDVFKRLMINSSDIAEHVSLHNLAITKSDNIEQSGIMPFYYFKHDDPERQHAVSGYSTFSKSKLENIRAGQSMKLPISDVSVPFESVSYFLKSRNIRHLDLLVTDVEGLDIELVTDFIHANVFPSIIYTEILDQPSNKYLDLINLLTSLGYSVGGNSSDLIAYRHSCATVRLGDSSF